MVRDISGQIGHFDISGENLATGAFGGALNVDASSDAVATSYRIVEGTVTGNTYVLTTIYPGTVVDESGAEITYAGVINGNKITIKETAVHAWHKREEVLGA